MEQRTGVGMMAESKPESKPATLTFPFKLDITLLPGMSLRAARLHARDQIGKALKGSVLTDALKALGLK
jgi:hypothetical protein